MCETARAVGSLGALELIIWWLGQRQSASSVSAWPTGASRSVSLPDYSSWHVSLHLPQGLQVSAGRNNGN